MKYKKLIEKSYLDYKEVVEDMTKSPMTKLDFLGEELFGFVTDDSNISKILAVKMLEVIKSINNITTFKYIESSKENYLNYITMVNISFLANKIDWGTSIRGAWWCAHGDKMKICEGVDIISEEIEIFMKDLVEWGEEAIILEFPEFQIH